MSGGNPITSFLPGGLGPVTLGTLAGTGRSVRLPADRRRTHLYACGSTGSGKSKFLEHLVRQDLTDWPLRRCGLLLIDPHGKLYDDLLGWMASVGVRRPPTVLIDLRRGDRVTGFNPLRRREGADPNVVVQRVIAAAAHVWGEEDTTGTPLFRQWATNTLRPLYDAGLPLSDAGVFLNDPGFRRRVLERCTDGRVRRDWARLERLRAERQDELLGSTARRLLRFLDTGLVRLMLGDPAGGTGGEGPGGGPPGLDLARAVREGWVVLCRLTPEGQNVSEEDCRTLGSLLLDELWATAREERGKGAAARPFHVVVDEFQEFVTPTVGRNLAQARGYGLCLTLAHQFPSQLRRRGRAGEALYDEVQANARATCAFQVGHVADRELLAEMLFGDSFDPDERKLETHRTATLGHEVRHETATHESHTHAETSTTSRTGGAGGSGSRGGSRGASEGVTLRTGAGAASFHQPYFVRLAREVVPLLGPTPAAATAADVEVGEWTPGDLRDYAASRTASEGESWADVESWNEAVTEATGASDATTVGTSRVPMLVPILGKELAGVQFRGLEEQRQRARAILGGQRPREFVARFGGVRAPLRLVVPEVPGGWKRPDQVAAYADALAGRWTFVVPREEAEANVAARHERVVRQGHVEHAGDREAAGDAAEEAGGVGDFRRRVE